MHEALGLIPISSPPPTPKIVLIAQEVTVRSLASWLRVVSLGCLLAALRAHGGEELRGGPHLLLLTGRMRSCALF